MKKNIQYLLLGVLALMSSCQDPEYVLPTAERQGITSLTALLHQVLMWTKKLLSTQLRMRL
ncbi:DUF5018 domain-containing protein [Bacteroides thetaiotaomicron]|uniref:DUF5018 domain-containing protein n=1 Tax=Bacteroides thetaiotaomicron TaxID=818 RepID=UPI0021662EC3|nr:DUF5018 domain-containing protein [Bacteroides thetaiotaomicron]MCS2721829.1 DUF5018 domain-containing protein [Bacteroides thetaiotaomicron]